MTSFRGRPIDYAVHDRKTDTYSLIGTNGECVAELQAREFLSISNRINLEVRSGRYRAAGSKDQRSANRKPGQAGRDDAVDAFAAGFSPWPTNRIAAQGPRAGLKIQDIIAAQRFINQSMSRAVLFGGMFEQEPLKRDGIVAGEIVGYRCWRIQRGDPRGLIGRLRSVYQNDVWNPGQILEGRELGDWDSRGIHAWKDSGSREYHAYIRSYLNREFDPFSFAFNNGDISNSDDRPAMVTGTVFLWGDVVEHQRGYRAEFARVRSLDWLYPDEIMMGREVEALGALRKLYGLPPEFSAAKASAVPR